jgi:hypothetical protein
MLSKCASPDCTSTLHYLREGKVFKIESESDMRLIAGQKKPARKVEHFWLCGPCSEKFTLINDKEAGVRVIEKPLMRRAAAS